MKKIMLFGLILSILPFLSFGQDGLKIGPPPNASNTVSSQLVGVSNNCYAKVMLYNKVAGKFHESLPLPICYVSSDPVISTALGAALSIELGQRPIKTRPTFAWVVLYPGTDTPWYVCDIDYVRNSHYDNIVCN